MSSSRPVPVRGGKARHALPLLLVLTILGCGGAGSGAGGPSTTSTTAGTDTAADTSAIGEAHAALIAALDAGDADGFVALLSTRPELVVFHPMVRGRFSSVEAVRNGLSHMFEEAGPTQWTDVHTMVTVDGDVGWLTGDFILEGAAPEEPFLGRTTEIWLRQPDGWRLIHAHWSPLPPEQS